MKKQCNEVVKWKQINSVSQFTGDNLIGKRNSPVLHMAAVKVRYSEDLPHKLARS